MKPAESLHAEAVAASNYADDGRYTEYDAWAWLYDQTVGPDYSAAQWQLLQRLLLPALPPQAQVLDLCCGSGQLIQPLLQAGYRVTGLDGSSAMLACARRNAPGAEYVLDDARRFGLPARFDAVFSTSASLNHIATLADLAQVFARVYACLRPGGVFLFDLNHPEQMARWWRGTPTEGEIRDRYAWMITPRYDAAARRGAFRVTAYRGERPLGAAARALARILGRPRFIGLRLALIRRFAVVAPSWKREDIDYPVTAYPLEDVEQALRAAGFTELRVETIDGRTPVDPNHSAHFICRRPQV